jgi:hypothetical protein
MADRVVTMRSGSIVDEQRSTEKISPSALQW